MNDKRQSDGYPINYDGQKMDWMVYFDRRDNHPFLMSVFVSVEGYMLEKETGKGYHHHMHICDGNKSYYIRSRSEATTLEEYYLSFLNQKKNLAKLQKWSKMGNKYYVKAEKLFKKFDGEITDKYIQANYDKIFSECEKIILYTTAVPYFMLTGVNHAIETGAKKEDFRETIDLLEHLRASTTYPHINSIVFPRIWAVAAKISGINDANLISYMTPWEVSTLMKKNRSPVDVDELCKRKEWCAFWCDPKTFKMQFSYDRALNCVIENKTDFSAIRDVKGNTAYKGKVHGIVKIVNTKDDMVKFNKDDVLVSINTNPSLIAAISKCSAIVTDEGGITCHAAIVSRELKRPCVIGTKIATKVFKDGDLVEVDADKGTVRLLEEKR